MIPELYFVNCDFFVFGYHSERKVTRSLGGSYIVELAYWLPT